MPTTRKDKDMDGEQNGAQQAGQEAQQQEQGGKPETRQAQHEAQGGTDAAGADTTAYEKQLAERDRRIEELEAQVASAAETAEAAKALRKEIAELKKQGESDRVEFELRLAGCRNVKAARAVLGDYKGDVAAMKEAEPWMFADAAPQPSGSTGLPNAGAATDSAKELKHWEELAGLGEE